MSRTLLTRYVQQSISTPAKRASSNPLATSISLGDVILESVEVSMPGGSVGLVGFAIRLAGQVILPYGGNAGFIIRESADHDYTIGIEVDQGLQVLTYNTDVHAHLAYFTFQVRDIFTDEQAPQLAQLVDVG